MVNDRLIETTMRLIDQKHGWTTVNLRTIAKEAGCAHTNIYNYFSSYESLLWATLESILMNWRQDILASMKAVPRNEDGLVFYLSCQIDFAMQHPGWYRSIWLEPFPDEPPVSLWTRLQELRNDFLLVICEVLGFSPNDAQLERFEAIVHGYVHGELCKLINSRSPITDAAEHKKRILEHSRILIKIKEFL